MSQETTGGLQERLVFANVLLAGLGVLDVEVLTSVFLFAILTAPTTTSSNSRVSVSPAVLQVPDLRQSIMSQLVLLSALRMNSGGVKEANSELVFANALLDGKLEKDLDAFQSVNANVIPLELIQSGSTRRVFVSANALKAGKLRKPTKPLFVTMFVRRVKSGGKLVARMVLACATALKLGKTELDVMESKSVFLSVILMMRRIFCSAMNASANVLAAGKTKR